MSCVMECGHTKRVHSDDYHDDNSNLVACLPCLKEAEDENERLRAALQRYSMHELGCMGRVRPKECVCGLTEVLAVERGQSKPDPEASSG